MILKHLISCCDFYKALWGPCKYSKIIIRRYCFGILAGKFFLQCTKISWSLLITNGIMPRNLGGRASMVCTVSKLSVFGDFLVHIFSHLNWIWRFTLQISVISPNTKKYGPEKLRIRAVPTQWWLLWLRL